MQIRPTRMPINCQPSQPLSESDSPVFTIDVVGNDLNENRSAVTVASLENGQSHAQTENRKPGNGVSAAAISRLGVFRATMASVAASICSMSSGFSGAYASPAIPDLNAHLNPFHMTNDQQSWFVSVGSLSSILGALITSVLVDKVGRKTIIILSCLPYVAAWVLIAGSSNPTMFIVARLISGFITVISITVVGVYIAEIAPANIRGLLMCLTDVLLNVGTLGSYVAGTYLRWNWLAIACAVPPVLLCICMLPVPETPRYLLMRGRDEEATAALVWLHGGHCDQVQADIRQIKMGLSGSSEKVPWSTLFKPPLLKYLAISQFLFILQDFCGFSIVRSYTVTIFQSSGSDLDPFMSTIIVGAALVLGAIVCTLVVDLFPRRSMYFLSATIMTIGHMALGTFFYLLDDHRIFTLATLYWLPLVSLLAQVFGYTLGFGSLPFIITSEMIPNRARGRCCCLGVVTLCVCSFLTAKFFEQLRLTVGDFGVFWLCGCFCFVGLVFVFFCVPETKGKSLEELERHLKLK